jgi:hypothetical protein
VLEILDDGWDLMVAHPPCTYLTCAGNKWFGERYRDRFPNRIEQMQEGANFFLELTKTSIPKVCIENPIGRMSTLYRKPDQIIQPYEYGHDAKKSTCLWLTQLPKLIPTNIVVPRIHITKSGNRMSVWHVELGNSKNKKLRAHLRSVTFTGIAEAMAEQWGQDDNTSK